jgi:NAD(P)-dependent dehydrogenase (short-subunit alcohol dehydrogenase family)
MNADKDPKQLEYMVTKIPMGRLGEIDDVAKISAWIVSEECTFSTGFLFDISIGRATY